MKNYKTMIAMSAAVVALFATERSAEATLTSGTSYLTQGTGADPVLQVNWTVTQEATDWLYEYSFVVVNSLTDDTANTSHPVTQFTVDASYVNTASGSGVINSILGTVVWSYSGAGVNSDTVSFTSDYGPTLGGATANDGKPSVSWADINTGGTQVPVPVPEASTVMAGALMLLPFGIGAIRSLRRERTV